MDRAVSSSVEASQQAPLPVGKVVLSSVVVLLITIFPLPVWSWWLRPELALMLVVYWVTAFPFRVGMVFAWTMGLALDLMMGRVLGQHALSLTIVAYLVLLFHQRVVIYSVGQEALGIFGLVLVYQLANYWVYGITGGMMIDFSFLLSALSSALLWPLFRFFVSAWLTR